MIISEEKMTEAKIDPQKQLQKLKIVLTLENSLVPEEKLKNTPSQIDGVEKEDEINLRILGCELIQKAGISLNLPQVAMATAQVLFQRFYYSKSFVRHNHEITAMGCVCLASKIEEEPRRIRDVINVFRDIKQHSAGEERTPMVLDQTYTYQKNGVIKAERRVLKELGFCVHVKHPHKLIVMYLQVLGFEKNQQFMQRAWNYMNDSLRTDVFMRYNPETIACACIDLTARIINIPLPSRPSWFGLFKVSEADIIDICYRVLDLYSRDRPDVRRLEETIDNLKKLYNESRISKKSEATPPQVTTVDRNNGSHNAWGGFIQRKLPEGGQQPTADKQTTKDNEKTPPAKKRSHSRSRSHSRQRSASKSRSRTPSDDYKRSSKKSRNHRSRSRSRSRSVNRNTKKKSRHYSRSPSNSPHNKHRKR